MLNHKNFRKGFSMIEMIIYISILVLMLGVIMNITISIVTTQRKVKSERNVDNSAVLTLERITREVRLADSIDSAQSIFDTSSGHLILDGTDNDGNSRVVEFYLSGGTVYLKEDSVVVGPVSQTDSTVTSLTFRHFWSGETDGIKTEITLESGTTTSYRSNNFYSSVIIR